MNIHLPTKAAIVAGLGDIAYGLALVAGFSYELGPVADFLPPTMKGEIAAASVFAGLALRFVQRAMERLQGIQDASNIAANAAKLSTTPLPVVQPDTK